MTLRTLAPLALLLAAPALAQTTPPPPASPPPSSPTQTSEDSGLSGAVSDDSDWQNLGIAIPAFATNADVPTQTSAGSTGALGFSMASVITADLQNNGLFKPTGPASLPRPALGQIQVLEFGSWSGRGAEMLVQGLSAPKPAGR